MDGRTGSYESKARNGGARNKKMDDGFLLIPIFAAGKMSMTLIYLYVFYFPLLFNHLHVTVRVCTLT